MSPWDSSIPTEEAAVRHIPAVLLTMLAAVALSTCGSSSAGDDATAGQSAQDKQEEARARLESCLRKEGVDVRERPAGGGRSSELEESKLRAAMEGPCRRYREQAFGNLTEDERQEMRDQMVKFASCMRKHGVDIPDPSSQPTSVRIDRDDPKVREATDACRELMPNRGRGGPGVMIGPGGPPEDE